MSYISELLKNKKNKKFGKWSFNECCAFFLGINFVNGMIVPISVLVLISLGIINVDNIISQSIISLSLYVISSCILFKIYNNEIKKYKYLLSEKEIKHYIESLNIEEKSFAISEIAKVASENNGNISLALLMYVDEKIIKHKNILNKIQLEKCIKNKYNEILISNTTEKIG